MNTTENNKIIVEFMGIADEIETGATSLIQIEGITGYYKNDNLKFHTDWNWLMEVVKECYSKEHNQNAYYEAIYYALADLNMQAVYNACLEFIKWHNEQK